MSLTQARRRSGRMWAGGATGGADVDTGADQLVVREKFAAVCLSNIFELASDLGPQSTLSKGAAHRRGPSRGPYVCQHFRVPNRRGVVGEAARFAQNERQRTSPTAMPLVCLQRV